MSGGMGIMLVGTLTLIHVLKLMPVYLHARGARGRAVGISRYTYPHTYTYTYARTYTYTLAVLVVEKAVALVEGVGAAAAAAFDVVEVGDAVGVVQLQPPLRIEAVV